MHLLCWHVGMRSDTVKGPNIVRVFKNKQKIATIKTKVNLKLTWSDQPDESKLAHAPVCIYLFKPTAKIHKNPNLCVQSSWHSEPTFKKQEERNMYCTNTLSCRKKRDSLMPLDLCFYSRLSTRYSHIWGCSLLSCCV